MKVFRNSNYYKIKCNILKALATIFQFSEYIEVQQCSLEGKQ